MKKQRGITLIELIITIIIMLILVSVVIRLSLGENGIFTRAKNAQIEHIRAELEEELQVKYANEITQSGGDQVSFDEFMASLPEEYNVEGGSEQYSVTRKGYDFQVTFEERLIKVTYGTTIVPSIVNMGIIQYVAKYINTSGYYDDININDETYNIHVIVVDSITFDGNEKEIEGITYGNNIYEIGNAESDPATGSEESNMAKYTVVLKVNGNMTVNNDITVTACKNSSGYGGPKGLLIYCSGILTNNGTISMTARGAYAEGQDVYLWKNSDNSYEYISKTGSQGGASYNRGYRNVGYSLGNNGTNGENRGTGGGASGGSWIGDSRSGTACEAHSGAGAYGTSYSGGPGGGGATAIRYNENAWANVAPTTVGGAGSPGKKSNQWDSQTAGSGAGNPSGGTGGLLIIYSKDIVNNSIISSNGSNGASGTSDGGGSGGGSINIFYKDSYTLGQDYSYSVTGGGSGTNEPGDRGTGGTGSISVGRILNGSFVDVYHNWDD